jgi:MFS family permease
MLIVPQALAALGMKAILRQLLAKIGYKGVLISNTLAIGLLLVSFTTIRLHTPVWQIVAIAFFYGACTSLQYTAMNTLVYADIEEGDTSGASSIASTMQQMAISFGVAIAGLTTAFFVPRSAYSDAALMIGGIHKALLCLGGLTLLSTMVFAGLKREDGDAVSEHKIMHPDG